MVQIAYLLENYIGTGGWQYRYIRGRCSYVVLSKAEKQGPYGELVSQIV